MYPRDLFLAFGRAYVLAVFAALGSLAQANEASVPIPLSTQLGDLDVDVRSEPPAESPMGMESSPVSCCRPCCPHQVWVNALFLSRDNSTHNALVFEGPKGSQILSTGEVDFDVAWGSSVGFTFCPNDSNPFMRLGVEFFAIDDWTKTRQTAGNVSVQFPSLPYLPELTVPGTPASGFGVATFNYNSSLYNTEFNLYRESSRFGWLSTLAGFRWIEIGEQFDTVFQTGATAPTYSINTNNHLYGFQVGAIANLHHGSKWRLDGWSKIGIYGNAADQDTVEDFTSAGGQVITASARSGNVAFATDVGVSLTRRLTERLSFKCSYMLLWIEGVALAPAQLDNSNPSSSIATLDNGGGVFYHGGFIGGEFLW